MAKGPSLSTPAPSPMMGQKERVFWGAMGGLLPSALQVTAQTKLAETIAGAGTVHILDAALPVLVFMFVGAVIAAAFREEDNRLQLLIIGVSAPAMISAWSSQGAAQQAATAVQQLKDIQILSPRPGASVPEKTVPQGWLRFEGPVVHAAAKTFARSEVNSADRIRQVFSGEIPNRNYFVILGSYAMESQAEQQAKQAQQKLKGLRIETYSAPPNYSRALYSVVCAANTTFDEAKAALAKVVKAGYESAYIWTFDLPIRPPAEVSTTGECAASVEFKGTGSQGAFREGVVEVRFGDQFPKYMFLYMADVGDSKAVLYLGVARSADEIPPANVSPDTFAKKYAARTGAARIDLSGGVASPPTVIVNGVKYSVSGTVAKHIIHDYVSVRVCRY